MTPPDTSDPAGAQAVFLRGTPVREPLNDLHHCPLAVTVERILHDFATLPCQQAYEAYEAYEAYG